MSTGVSPSYESLRSGTSLCAWNGDKNGSCPNEAAADFVIRINDGPEEVHDIASIPLCFAHSRDEAFLSWLTRLAHSIALRTVTALRDKSLAGFRFTYRLVEREPLIDGMAGSIAKGGFWSLGGVTVGSSSVAIAMTARRDRRFVKTFAVPSKPGMAGETKTPRVVARARIAWYNLTEGERAFYEQIAAAKGLPGIHLFVSRYVTAVRGGKRSESLVSVNDVLPD